MHYFEIAPNQIIRADQACFTYKSQLALEVGQIVLIEIGNKHLPGIVISKTSKPNYETKEVLKIIETQPLPRPLVNLAIWISTYYATNLGLVVQTILPSGLEKKRRTQTDSSQYAGSPRKRTKNVLNKDQSAAIGSINKFKSGTFILHGITGSGKTEVYIRLIKDAIASNKSAFVLVPEIALTSQIISELANSFDNLVLTHSQMTESARHIAWKKILYANTPLVVVGPRSALFMPLKNVGVIIIDEEHETSFKQEHAPRYSAIRAASILGKQHTCPVILGSATPSVVDYYLAEHSNRPILKLQKTARKNALPAKISLIDMTDRSLFKKHRFLSDYLINSIHQSLNNKKQILIFQNRRGGASTTLCENCGWIAECPDCRLPMTLHIAQHCLKCHVCGREEHVPTSCPECSKSNIIHKGIGTQLIEQEVKKIFPEAKIARFDADTDIDNSLAKLYNDIYQGNIDIIIGTQIVAKGLDLPELETVGIVQADTGLSIPDFNSDEKTFQLLTQAIGRVGRNSNRTEVIVQTFQPHNPNIVFGVNQDYTGFYEHTINDRKNKNFPPFMYLLKLSCSFKTETTAISSARKIADQIIKEFPETTILGPSPCLHERQGNMYRWQIVVKSQKRATLVSIAERIKSPQWHCEIDPTGLI